LTCVKIGYATFFDEAVIAAAGEITALSRCHSWNYVVGLRGDRMELGTDDSRVKGWEGKEEEE